MRHPTTSSWCRGPDDVPHIVVRDPSRVAWLSQTTLSVDETLETVAAIRERFPELLDPPSDDICYATQNRQLAVKEIARNADLVIVVGSGNSSNSVRLVEVALEAGAKAAYRVDDADEIDEAWLDGVKTVSVTSGASVPEALVDGRAGLPGRAWLPRRAGRAQRRGVVDLRAPAGAPPRPPRGRPRPRPAMARFLDVHPDNPQQRLLDQVVAALRDDDALIAYPTDSGYALGCRLGNRDGRDRILRIRGLDDRHHFTLMCRDFSQLGQLVHVDKAAFRAIKAATPGPYTFILPATPEVPRRLLHPRKRTVGVRIPDHVFDQALLETPRRGAAHQLADPPGRDRAPHHGLGDQGGARQRRRHRRRGRRDARRADHRHRLVRRGSGGREGRARAIRRGSSPDPDSSAGRDKSRDAQTNSRQRPARWRANSVTRHRA